MDPKDITLTDGERQPCEVWTRCMGYHRPVAAFNKGKKQEFEDRKAFTMQAADASPYGRRVSPWSVADISVPTPR